MHPLCRLSPENRILYMQALQLTQISLPCFYEPPVFFPLSLLPNYTFACPQSVKSNNVSSYPFNLGYQISRHINKEMGYSFNRDAGAALVFGVLYLGLWLWMTSGYVTGRYKLRSRWTLLLFHVTVRVASQVSEHYEWPCYLQSGTVFPDTTLRWWRV